MQKIVSVSREDIRMGYSGCPEQCAVALALEREGFSNVYVDKVTIAAEIDGNYYGFPVSRRLSRWLERYDKQKPVKPIRFIVNVYQ